MKEPEFERSEVDVPEVVVDFLQSDILLAQNVTDVDPVGVPADAAVETDSAHSKERLEHQAPRDLTCP